MASWLEALRDRVLVRSLVGKRKLDAVFLRRERDRIRTDLGERLLALVREGRVAVPQELATLVAEAREVEGKLEAQHAEIAELESEPI